ncbi:MAG: 3'(2'),5'-bisphosphate nucleotidase CysQ [Chloroflexota bacterium]
MSEDTHHSSLIPHRSSSFSMNQLLREVIQATRAAGAAILAYYQDSFTVRDKSPDNPVTEADLAADALLKERLLTLLPEAGWLSEETADNPQRLTRRLVWVVDPLDGTKDFVLGIPEFAVSVALVEDGQPILAVIFNPAAGQLFHAQKGMGAWLDGRPVTVSGRAELRGARVDASRSERKRGEFAPFEGMVELTTMGSIAYKLARVAAGLTDATWSRGPKNEWDVCAGVLLVLEGGGRCTDLHGEPLVFNRPRPKVNGIVADNGRFHSDLIATLSNLGAARL